MSSTETQQVSTYGMGVAQQRFSSLTQVNKSTMKNLVPVWNTSLDNSANMSTQPLVIDGVMYVVTHNSTTAIDASTGRQMWKTSIDLPSDVTAMVCCGIQARGLAVQNGVIYRATLDAHLQAMDAKDGKILWRTKVVDYKLNEAPMVEVYIVPSTETPGGLGEPGTSALAPALANAVYAATKQRIRKLPLSSGGLKEA